MCIVGLGYVGLPLALEFGKHFPTIGYDNNQKRVDQLRKSIDETGSIDFKDFEATKKIEFTNDHAEISDCNIYIMTVPTPIDKYNTPDMTSLIESSKIIGKNLKKNDIIIYESTVYPGATEEVCIPVLEKFSGLIFNRDFFVGYSPERINPGDKYHTLTNTAKLVSGSTEKTLDILYDLYERILSNPPVKVENIRVAEAAKVIENIQRDVNIGLINELCIIFDKLNIKTEKVLEAASTKWNFLNFRPGLVGGHCIGVDPYYLTHKCDEVGVHADLILAGRKINDSMSKFAAQKLVKNLVKKNKNLSSTQVLILGFAFKENCRDIRNTKIKDLMQELVDFGLNVSCYDPLVDNSEVIAQYGFELIEKPKNNYYDAIIIAVPHDHFRRLKITQIRNWGRDDNIIYDLKYLFPEEETDLRL